MAAIASRSQPSHGHIFAFDRRYVRDTDINGAEDEEYGTMSRPRIPRERSYRAPAAARGGGFTDYTSVKSAPTSAATSAAVSPARSPIPSYRRQRSVTFVSGRDGVAARANGGAERQDHANSTNRSTPFQREERPEYHTLTSDSAVKAAKEAMAELFAEKRRYVEQQSIMAEAAPQSFPNTKAPITTTTTDASILVSNPVFSHSSSSGAVEEYLSQKNLNSYSAAAAAAAFATQLPLQNQSSRPQDGGAFGVTPYNTLPDMGSRAGSMRSRSMTPRRRRAHEKRKAAEEDLSFYDDSFVEEFVLSTRNELEERERAAREERERAEALLIKAAEAAKRARALEEQQLRIEAEEERRQARQKNNREGRRSSQSYRRADDDVDGAATNGNASKKTNNGGVASLIHEHTRRMQYTPRRRAGCDDEDDEENDNFSTSSSVDNSNDNDNDNDADDVESEYRAYSASHHRTHQNRTNLDSHNSLPMVTRRAAAATGSSSLKRNRDDCSECPTCGSHSAPRHSDRRRVEEEYDPQQTDRKKNANKTPAAPTSNVRGRGPRAASSAAAVVGVTFASPLQDVRVPNSQLTSSDDSDDNDDDHRDRLLEKGRGGKGGKGANTTDRSSSKGGRRIESTAEAVEGVRCRSVTSTSNARGTANNHDNNNNSKNNPNPYEEGDTLLERLHSVDRPVLLGRVRRGAKATNNSGVSSSASMHATVTTNNSFTGGGANQMFSEEAQRATARRRRTGTATAATAPESAAQTSAVGRARTRGEKKSDNDTSSNSVFGDKETDDLVFGAPVVSGAGGRRAKFAATTQKAGRGGKVASSTPAPPLFSSAAFDPTDPMSVFFESAFPTPSKYDAVVNGSTSNVISAAPVGRRKNANGSFPLMLPTTIAKKR